MPFGLKLRRTRRYNVLSKNYFVTRIRLLDNNVIECTLSVESTGQECLEAVAQRLELREVSALFSVAAKKHKIICQNIICAIYWGLIKVLHNVALCRDSIALLSLLV